MQDVGVGEGSQNRLRDAGVGKGAESTPMTRPLALVLPLRWCKLNASVLRSHSGSVSTLSLMFCWR
jgi:hypothetical protein